MITLVSLKEAARMVHMEIESVRALAEVAKFPGMIQVPGKKQRAHFLRDEVQAWLTERQVNAAVAQAVEAKRRGAKITVPEMEKWDAVGTSRKRKAYRTTGTNRLTPTEAVSH